MLEGLEKLKMEDLPSTPLKPEKREPLLVLLVLLVLNPLPVNRLFESKFILGCYLLSCASLALEKGPIPLNKPTPALPFEKRLLNKDGFFCSSWGLSEAGWSFLTVTMLIEWWVTFGLRYLEG